MGRLLVSCDSLMVPADLPREAKTSREDRSGEDSEPFYE